MRRTLICGLWFFVLATAGWPQSPSAQRGTTSPSPVMLLQKDYKALAVQANQLSAQALPPLRSKALAGDVRSAEILGMAYEGGCPGAPRDAKESLRWYYLAAERGSLIAANQIAVSFDPAEGFAGTQGHDPEAALKWYLKAAEHGDDLVAIDNVGQMLQQMERYAEAADWLRRAMENGSPESARNLADLYDRGRAVPSKSKEDNRREALQLFQRLATEGNAGAQFVMAKAYLHGWFGAHRQPLAAVELFRKAAEQEMPTAQLVMGDLYYNGKSVQKDKAEAVKWYLKAAEQNQPEAQLNLAFIYEDGDGVPKDVAAAYMWYELAREGRAPGTRYPTNATEAGNWVRLHHHFTAAELGEGEKSLRAWKMEHGRVTYLP